MFRRLIFIDFGSASLIWSMKMEGKAIDTLGVGVGIGIGFSKLRPDTDSDPDSDGFLGRLFSEPTLKKWLGKIAPAWEYVLRI
jgi:hypothetical protein